MIDPAYWLLLAAFGAVSAVAVGVGLLMLAMVKRLHTAYTQALRDMARAANYSIRQMESHRPRPASSMSVEKYKEIQKANRERIRQLNKDPEKALKNIDSLGGAEFRSGA